MNTTTATSQADSQSSYEDSHPGHDGPPAGYRGSPALERPVHDRMLAGVAAGVARYLNVDVTVVRIVFAVLTVVGGAALPIYLAGWLLIPEDGADQSIAAGWFQPRTN